MLRLLLLGMILALTGAADDLKSRVDQLIAGSPALANAFLGFEVLRADDGQILYQLNADHLFVPASNMKLFTSALALSRLGPDYRFKTQVVADRPIDSKGTLAGDLLLVGGGDPSLSGRAYPYQYQPAAPGAGYSFRAIEELVDQLVSRGLKRIDGNIVGDDRRYVWEPHADVWALGDATWEYGAPVSALILNDNSLALTLRPAARTGDLAQVSLTPALEHLWIDNRVRTETGTERKLEFERKPQARELHIRGVLPTEDPGVSQLLAVDDPALYAAEALRDALERRGVAIHGRALASHRFADDVAVDPSQPSMKSRVVLGERTSPPLAELLEVVDKVSQNLHAEVMLREVGLVRKQLGSREAGLADMREFLTEIGVPKDSCLFTDGSGLSRSTLVTPAAVAALLAYMYKSANRDLWMSLLPVAGADGTLATRFADHPEARAIRAKTGTLAHVRAMSGYVTAPGHDPLVFSLLVNNHNAPASEMSRALDQLALELLR